LLEPHPRRDAQFNASHDPIPIPLRVVGNAMGVHAYIDYQAVVDPDRQPVASRRKGSKVILVRRGQTVIRAEGFAIDPNTGFPVWRSKVSTTRFEPHSLGISMSL
jgi:hypothetical protein